MKLIVRDYNTDRIDWVVEADHITVQPVNKDDKIYYDKYKFFVYIFSYRYAVFLGTLYIDYGSKYELLEDEEDELC